MSRPEKDSVQEVAAQVTLRVKKGEILQAALDDVLRASCLSVQERRRCSDLAYSFYRLQIKTFWILEQVLKNPGGLPEPMLTRLALAVTSLLAQDATPEYAVVCVAVEQIGKKYGKSLAGVANAALRSVLRLGDKLQDRDWYIRKVGQNDALAGLAIYYGIPLVMARFWRERYGEDNALALLARSSARPWKGVRINSRHPDASALRQWFYGASGAYVELIGEWGVALAPAFEAAHVLGKPLQDWIDEGALEFQAAGSQLILEKLGVLEWREPVYDCCAGSGGKSRALVNSGVPVVLASDTSVKRLQIFRKLWRQTSKCPALIRMNAARPALAAWAGSILADVPCTGMGVLARRPDLRAAANNFQEKLAQFRNAQRGILQSCAALLRPKGRLAYVTCTLNPDENEKNIAWLLDKNSLLTLEKEWQTPFSHPWLEGMYGAVLIRK